MARNKANPRYAAGSGRWYKGAPHAHSTASDGALDPKAMVSLYEDTGYDFLFLTDHDITSDIEQYNGRILAINGVELSEAPGEPHYHLLGLGVPKQIPRPGTQNAMATIFPDLLRG